MPSGAPLDWKEARQWNIAALHGLFQNDPKSLSLTRSLTGRNYEVGGDEHHLFHLDEDPGRIFKATYGDSFGCRPVFDPVDAESTGRHFLQTLNDDPRFYLRRWILLNRIGGYKTRFEGILPPEAAHWAPRICISQPWLDEMNPSPAEITRSMLEVGFIEISGDAFYRPRSGLLLTDAAPRNVKISNGGPVPFDAIAEEASDEVKRWAAGKF
jgi:hypothetical protein